MFSGRHRCGPSAGGANANIPPGERSGRDAPMTSLVVYYSRTGTTHSVAGTVGSHLPAPDVHRIRPVTERRYLNWLVRSAVPGSRVPIEDAPTDLSGYDAVFLGIPKWTLSCPPATEYVETADFSGATVGVFVTYGGFDEERYLQHFVDDLERRGARVPATLRVQRDAAGTERSVEGAGEFVRATTEG